MMIFSCKSGVAAEFHKLPLLSENVCGASGKPAEDDLIPKHHSLKVMTINVKETMFASVE